MSPFFIHLSFLNIPSKHKVNTAGAMKCIITIVIIVYMTLFVCVIAANAPNCPTNPEVPILASSGVLVIPRTAVDMGPRIADANVGAIQI